MSVRTGLAILVLLVMLILGGIGIARNWRKPVGWHRDMVTTTYSWLGAMPARWAFYRALPALWAAMAVFWLDMAATAWLKGGDVTLYRLATKLADWSAPGTGVLLLIAISVFLVSRPHFLIFPALRSQPYLLQVWDNPGMSPDGGPADSGEADATGDLGERAERLTSSRAGVGQELAGIGERDVVQGWMRELGPRSGHTVFVHRSWGTVYAVPERKAGISVLWTDGPSTWYAVLPGAARKQNLTLEQAEQIVLEATTSSGPPQWPDWEPL
ncbi:hypothetical protein [Allorhizocola rhizosphaerae]|uniref:hypothetical protein n=1 Tax=Allorhizocola rhizosphaerae TaxID=1872709 RepID=UPI000E3C9B92|nr:hypothetical protein [Allorhizocola rhizosphaerae]